MREKLAAAGESILIEAVEETGSTNSDLLARIRSSGLSPTVLVARRQSAGRGSHGRMWQNAPESLLFSIALPFTIGRTPPAVPVVVGYAVASALRKFGAEVFVKWPNDLWTRSGKLGGILCETALSPSGERFLVVGIGINILAGKSGVTDRGYRAASLDDSMEVGEPVAARSRLLSLLIPAIVSSVRNYSAAGVMPPGLQKGGLDMLAGKTVEVDNGCGAAVCGRYGGITENGAIVVVAHDGRRSVLYSGTVRIVQPCFPGGVK